jgi:hypothetical protein
VFSTVLNFGMYLRKFFFRDKKGNRGSEKKTGVGKEIFIAPCNGPILLAHKA